MKLEQSHIDEIRTEFEKMQSREDLLHVLNLAKSIVYGDKAIPFELKQLTWYAFPKLGAKRYTEFKIKKKSGSERVIHAPVKGLKSIQKTLSFVLQCIYEPHNAVMGFVRDKSIVDNANLHVGSRYVYNLDLKDFFPSIDQARVWKVLQLNPFRFVDIKVTGIKRHPKSQNTLVVTFDNGFRALASLTTLITNKDGEKEIEFLNSDLTLKEFWDIRKIDEVYWIVRPINFWGIAEGEPINNLDIGRTRKSDRKGLAGLIASICCTEMEVERKNEAGEWERVKRNVLPQGAPTSPVLTNIICQKLDFLLTGVAKRFGLKYSRYADDITFSSLHNVYQPGSEFLKELHRIISEQNFHIKESKTRLQKDGYRKEVTGLLVNEKVNVKKRYIKQLRMWLYYWERYGYERATVFFLQQYIAEKGHVKNGKPDMGNVISGKLDFLKMVKGYDNELYLKLKGRFERLAGKVECGSKNIIENEESVKSDNPLISILGGLIEELIVTSTEKSIDISSLDKIEVKQVPILHSPKQLERLLRNFSANNHPLKYACHSWEDGKVDGHFDNYSDFLKKYDELGRPACFEIQRIKRTLGAKVLHFLNTPNENSKYLKKDELCDYYWGEYRMKYGWKSKELGVWAKDNPSKDPFDFPLPNKTIITRNSQDLEISKFGDVISLFKSEIEIRPEKSDLYNLFVELRRKYLGRDFKVDIGASLKGKQFYTDVHDFKRALNKIFREISARTIHPNISISATNYPENGYTIIEVLHAESYCTEKNSKEMLKEINDGDFADILECLKDLCDWSVESMFSDGAYRINYLASSETEEATFPIEEAEGFKHVFKFYKS